MVLKLSILFYFNSRPCERGDHNNPAPAAVQSISILAPARGATIELLHGFNLILFQFSPLREGRRSEPRYPQYCHSYFNSRPCERGDAKYMDDLGISLFQFSPLREGRQRADFHSNRVWHISILAPARGATRKILSLSSATNYFNSRPCERGDNVHAVYFSIPAQFQFSPLREGRPMPESQPETFSQFQFSPLREGRHTVIENAKRAYQFQFSPLREGRQAMGKAMLLDSPFQFSPLREGRLLDVFATVIPRLFQFSPLREGRPRERTQLRGGFQFQFSPLREGRLCGGTTSS